MKARDLLAEAPWPLMFRSLGFPCRFLDCVILEGVEVLRGSVVSQRKSNNGIQQQGLEFLDCSGVFFS